MIEQAFISGQLGKAIYEDGGRYFVMQFDVTEPQECRPMDFSTFFNFGAEVKSLSPGQDLVSLRRQLQTQTNEHYALRLVVGGMDPVLDLETRSEVIDEADDLLQNEQTYRFVSSRLLSRPLSGEEDIVKARDLAVSLKTSKTAALYQAVIEASDYISVVQKIWNETAAKYFSTFEDQAKATQELADLGVFADVTSVIVSKKFDALSSIVVRYAQKVELKGALRPGSLILNDFRRRLTEVISRSSEDVKADDQLEREDAEEQHDASTEALLSRSKNRRDNRKTRIFTADKAKEKVDSQIAAISKLIDQGNFSLADRYLTDLIGFQVKHSQREHLGMSLCSLAKVAIDARSFALAERMVNEALRLGIDDAVILSTQAELAKSLGEFDKALVVYEEAIERFPNDEVVRNGYAEVLKATGDFDKALTIYEEAMERFPNNQVTRNGYAEVLKATGEFDKALAFYKETMRRFPNDEVTRNGFAEVLKATGQFDQSLAIYEETISRFPDNEVALCGYAEVLKTTGKFDKALTAYEKAMSRFPSNEVALCGYAEVLKTTGELDKALTAYDEAMSRFPNSEVALCGYAEVLKTTGEFDKALALYAGAITRFPNNEVALCGYAEVLKSTGEFDRALAVYKEGLTGFPNDRVCRGGYASVLVLLGRFEEARSFLSRSTPRSKEDWIDYHIIAMSYLKEGNIDEAIAMFTFGLENAPYENQAHFVTAWAVAKIRKQDFEAVIKLLPVNVPNIDTVQRETRLALVGHSQAALGKKTEANEIMSELEDARNPGVSNLKDALARRYSLGKYEESLLSSFEADALDVIIYDQEFLLAA